MSDIQWELVEPLLPSNAGRRGHPFGDNRRVVEGIVYRHRTGIPWRNPPREEFGPWQPVWKPHRRYAGDDTWDTVLSALLMQAHPEGKIDWSASVDAAINRAHQHATNTTRPEQDTGARANHKDPGGEFVPSPLGGEHEPAGHGIGRWRRRLTTKIHHAVDGRGRPMAAVITGGQRNDGTMLIEVLADIRVLSPDGNRPRTRPDAVLADRAYATGPVRSGPVRSANVCVLAASRP